MRAPRPEVFRQAAAASPRLSLADMLGLHGEESPAVLLLVLAVLCVLPIYGVGSALSLAILLMAWRWCQLAQDPGPGHRPRALPERLGRITLDETWSRRCLEAFAWLYGTAGRRLKERWTALCHRSTRTWWGLWIALMAFLIFLPLPFGNVLPSLSLVLLSLGWMFRDGLAMLLSAVVGSGALAFAIASGHLLLEGARIALDWVARWAI